MENWCLPWRIYRSYIVIFYRSLLVSYWFCNKFPQRYWLKQHRFITLQIWRSEVQNRCHWTKTKMSAGLCSSGGSGGESIFLPFPDSRGRPHSLAPGPFSIFKASYGGSCRFQDGFSLFLTPLFPSSPLKYYVITLSPPGIISLSESQLISNFISSAILISPCHTV